MSKTLAGRQMQTGMFRPTAGGELVPDGGRCPAGPRRLISGVDPEPCGFGFRLLDQCLSLCQQSAGYSGNAMPRYLFCEPSCKSNNAQIFTIDARVIRAELAKDIAKLSYRAHWIPRVV